VVEYRVSARGDVEPVHLGNERVALGECIEKTGRIGGRALLSALAAAARLVAGARAAGKNLHIVVVASETIALARNSDRFFSALKRHVGVTTRIVVPPGVLARTNESAGLVASRKLPQVVPTYRAEP
jgi:exopolyphosphatase/pppGpp-phosphohydrolase